MDDSDKQLDKTTTESALDIASAVSSAIPWLGGPVSNVLGGMSTGRKLERIKGVLTQLADELTDFKSEVSEDYVKSEDFEELLEQALRRASEERSEEKRKVYGNFLIRAIETPGEAYDEQLRFLRTLEQLQPDHINLLRALDHPPGDIGNIMMGSPFDTLQHRLPGMGEPRISDLTSQLNDLRLTDLTGLHTMMTANGAQDLRGRITTYGRRFMSYLADA